MRRTSPFTISSSNKYSGFRGSLWSLNYFCGEEKIKSDIFSAAHCHEPLCSPFFLFWCLLFHIPFSTKSHCPLAAFIITDSSLLSFILRLFSTSSFRSANMPHTAGKPVSVMGAKKENKTAVVQSKDHFLSVSLHKLDYTWEKNSNFLSTGHWSPYSMKTDHI